MLSNIEYLLQNLQDETDALKKQLDRVKDLAEGLIADASPASDTSHIRKEVDDLEDRFNKLTKGIDGRCADLESASQLIDQFMVYLMLQSTLQSWFL